MKVEDFFEQEKGITVDGARNVGAKYTAIDLCRFAKKYYEKETKKDNWKDLLNNLKKGKSVTFDDAWYYIGIEEVEYKLLHSSEYHDALKIILTSDQYDEHNACDTSRVFNVSDARISKFLDFYNGKENVWRRTNTSKQ